MAEKTITQGVEDLVTVYQTLFFDLPVVSTRWELGIGKEKEVTETAWKGYDAWVRLATATINNLYRIPLFGEVVARSLDASLRWQRLSNALIGASFAGLWPAVGLPTAAAVQGLRAEVQTLREELYSAATDLRLVASIQANGKLATPPAPLRDEEPHSPVAVRLIPSKESATLTTDLSEYFEPVADSAQSAPGLEQKESNEREAITKLDVRTEALQIDRSRTKHPLPPWPPYGRAGGQAANKRAAKGKVLR